MVNEEHLAVLNQGVKAWISWREQNTDVKTDLRDTDPTLFHGDLKNIRNLMWQYVGLVRNEYHMVRALRELRILRFEIEEFYSKTKLTDEPIRLRNAMLATRRNEVTRGVHYRADAEPDSVYSLSDL